MFMGWNLVTPSSAMGGSRKLGFGQLLVLTSHDIHGMGARGVPVGDIDG